MSKCTAIQPAYYSLASDACRAALHVSIQACLRSEQAHDEGLLNKLNAARLLYHERDAQDHDLATPKTREIQIKVNASVDRRKNADRQFNFGISVDGARKRPRLAHAPMLSTSTTTTDFYRGTRGTGGDGLGSALRKETLAKKSLARRKRCTQPSYCWCAYDRKAAMPPFLL